MPYVQSTNHCLMPVQARSVWGHIRCDMACVTSEVLETSPYDYFSMQANIWLLSSFRPTSLLNESRMRLHFIRLHWVMAVALVLVAFEIPTRWAGAYLQGLSIRLSKQLCCFKRRVHTLLYFFYCCPIAINTCLPDKRLSCFFQFFL